MLTNSRVILLITSIFLLIAYTCYILISQPLKVKDEYLSLINQAQINMENGLYDPTRQLLYSAISISNNTQLLPYELLAECQMNLELYKDAKNTLLDSYNKNIISSEKILELASLYKTYDKYDEYLTFLKEAATKFEDIKTLYEEERYAVYVGKTVYSDVQFGLNNIVVTGDVNKNVINSSGKTLSDKAYYDITGFDVNTGYAIALEDSVATLVNIKGWAQDKFIDKIKDVVFYGDGYGILVDENDMYILVDSELNIILKDRVFISCPYKDTFAVKTTDMWRIYSAKENKALTGDYVDIAINERGNFTENSLYFADVGNGYQLYSSDCKLISDNSYDTAYPFGNGVYAAVCSGGKWGFIDYNSNLIIDYKYDDAKSFSYTIAPVCLDGKWGYISRNDVIVIENVYENATPTFINGTGMVCADGLWKSITLVEYS